MLFFTSQPQESRSVKCCAVATIERFNKFFYCLSRSLEMSASVFLSFVLAQVYRDSQVPSVRFGEGQSQIFVTLLCCSRFTELTWSLPGKTLQENTALSAPDKSRGGCPEIRDQGELKRGYQEILMCQRDPWECTGNTDVVLLTSWLSSLGNFAKSDQTLVWGCCLPCFAVRLGLWTKAQAEGNHYCCLSNVCLSMVLNFNFPNWVVFSVS